MINISFYGSHNAAYVVEKDGEIILVLEVERFLNIKNGGLAQYKYPKPENILFYSEYIPKFIMKYLGINEFDNCYSLNSEVILDRYYHLEKHIPAKNYIHNTHHHMAHAAGCFYQSPFNDALIFSFDGGGDDGFFCVYKANRKTSIQLLETVFNPTNKNIHYDLGFPYMIFAHYMKDIKHEDISEGNLVYPGKIMGLASYGVVRENWLPYFIEFYKSGPNGSGVNDPKRDYEIKIENLGEKIGVNFDSRNRLEGQIAWDIAATSQRAFDECFLEIAIPYMNEYKDLQICIAGGCGLNILLNTRIVQEFKKNVFIGPNPNDCGVAAGLLLHNLKPQKQIILTYSGLPLLDINSLSHYIEEKYFFNNSFFDINIFTTDLLNGKIIGVARGRSEHGPRALGNRSILCNPMVPNMKDILNQKVKHREWYRPFAPVVRLEDVSKYFEWEGESQWMSFCPKVRKEWREKLVAITHVDNTARVQTVTKEQNEWLYNLLTEFEKKSGVGVLLNTSFNVAGKPILSTLKDAFKIFEESEMDGLIIEDYYFKKK